MEKDQIQNPSLHSREQQDTTAAAASGVSSEQEEHPWRPHLCIDIPPPADHLPTPTQGGGTSSITPPSSTRRGQQQTSGGGSSIPISTPASSSSRPPLRSPSFMLRQTVRSLLPAGSFRGYEASFSKLFGATKTKVMSRTSSLPLDDALSSSSAAAAAQPPPPPVQQKPAAVHHMCRSLSLPMNMKKLNGNAKSFKRMDSLGGMYRVVPAAAAAAAASTTPRAAAPAVADILPSDSSAGTTAGGEGMDIAEEEAVCRICMVELSEGSDTVMKLECACKGELALAHRDCAVKWFSIKGSRTCEVCKHDVRNLPVTLLRLQSMQQVQQQQRDLPMMNRHGGRYRVWHGTPILVIISILAYFCFLEELLVAHEGIAALAISLPFSCILGLFSSLTTTSMVARRYVWIYAAVQFLLVVFFTHLFYKYLHLQAVISIILATFAGFGVGMTGNSITVEIVRWRARRVAPPATTQQARRHRRARAPHQQQQAPPASASDQPSSQPSGADVGVGQQQHDATATAAGAGAGDVDNPAVHRA